MRRVAFGVGADNMNDPNFDPFKMTPVPQPQPGASVPPVVPPAPPTFPEAPVLPPAPLPFTPPAAPSVPSAPLTPPAPPPILPPAPNLPPTPPLPPAPPQPPPVPVEKPLSEEERKALEQKAKQVIGELDSIGGGSKKKTGMGMKSALVAMAMLVVGAGTFVGIKLLGTEQVADERSQAAYDFCDNPTNCSGNNRCLDSNTVALQCREDGNLSDYCWKLVDNCDGDCWEIDGIGACEQYNQDPVNNGDCNQGDPDCLYCNGASHGCPAAEGYFIISNKTCNDIVYDLCGIRAITGCLTGACQSTTPTEGDSCYGDCSNCGGCVIDPNQTTLCTDTTPTASDGVMYHCPSMEGGEYGCSENPQYYSSFPGFGTDWCGIKQWDQCNGTFQSRWEACIAPTEGPGPTEPPPTNTPTASPTPTTPPACNSVCTSNAQCPGELVCDTAGSGRCRLDTCLEESTCTCPPTPTPTTPPVLACFEVSLSNMDPNYGDTITLTCDETAEGMVATRSEFQVSINQGEYTEITNNNDMSTEYTISTIGNYRFRCRVCADETDTSCTAW